MKTRALNRISRIIVTAMGAAFSAPMAGAAADPVAVDVLDLREASALLRVPPKIVTKLAASGTIPARRVGSNWRFNRVALMEWLQGDRYAYPAVPKKAAEPGSRSSAPEPATTPSTVSSGPTGEVEPLGSGLRSAELAAVTARGAPIREPIRIAQAPAAPSAGASAATPPAQVGERPTGQTAEEVALRRQGASVLPGGVATIELGLAYSRQVRESFSVLRVEQDTASATLTGRYGIKDDLQVSARLPMRRERTSIYADPDALGSGVSLPTQSESYLGDMALSLLGVAMQERTGRPNVILSLDGVVPTGPGDSGIGAGLVLSKSYDPVVVFAGVNYLYGIDVDANDGRRVLAKHNTGFNLGYAYAINDTIALSGQFAGIYRTPREGTLPAEKESYLLQLGLTWQLGQGLFVEPSVAFGVGGVAPDFTFSLNLPYTF